MNTLKANLLSIIAFTFYFIWWFYIIFDLGAKDYDNNYAGGLAAEFIAAVTFTLMIIYSLVFLIAAFKTKKWLKYFGFIFLTIMPGLAAYIYFTFFDS